MLYLTDVRWIIILPLILSALFVTWVFWNLSREIWMERRRWVRYYRESDHEARRPGKEAQSLSAKVLHAPSEFGD